MQIPNYIIDLLKEYYDDETINSILDGYSTRRVQSFRVNLLKSNKEEIIKELQKNNIKYEIWNVYDNAFIVDNDVLIKDLDIYKEGKIYLQSLSSMLPPLFLDIKPNMDILDMAAAPGGKTSLIAGIANNETYITAVEIDKIRMERLKYNMEKLGITNICYVNLDATKLDDFFRFDSILLDAPCSGSGTLSVYDKSFEKFSIKLVKNSSILQKKLLSKALTILKPGSTMIYSTCSLIPLENEMVLESVMKNYNCEIIKIDNSCFEKVDLLPTKIEGTIGLKPNKCYEGFFIAKILKH